MIIAGDAGKKYKKTEGCRYFERQPPLILMNLYEYIKVL